MNKCIFCLSVDQSRFNTKEHILPESIGRGDWAILPDGLYCDSCQNKFGSSIEQQALADYPFVNLRTILGIPTKKGKAPWFKYWEGVMRSGGEAGKIFCEPNNYFKQAFESGRKTLSIFPTMTLKPDMILRTLIKIGIELIAVENTENVFEEKFNPARQYSLTGIKKFPWFYIQKEDCELLNLYVGGVEWEDEHCFMQVYYEDSGLVFLHLRIFYLEFLVPLVENVVLDADNKFDEPEERVVIV